MTDSVFNNYEADPKIIQAVRLSKENFDDVLSSMGQSARRMFKGAVPLVGFIGENGVNIYASYGDWIVRENIRGCYSCMPDYVFKGKFKKTKNNKATERKADAVTKVFLGGTYNSCWREWFKPKLKDAGINYFDPVVDDWNEEVQKRELKERESCDFVLYTITSKMIGCYSVAEVVDDSNKRPEKTIFLLMTTDSSTKFYDHERKSLDAVVSMVKRNGGAVFVDDMQGVVDYMSSESNPKQRP